MKESDCCGKKDEAGTVDRLWAGRAFAFGYCHACEKDGTRGGLGGRDCSKGSGAGYPTGI